MNIAVLKCIFYVNVSNIIGNQNLTSLPQHVVGRKQGYDGLLVTVLAAAVIPVSRSLVTGIQYQYILLLLFKGCLLHRTDHVVGKERGGERGER